MVMRGRRRSVRERSTIRLVVIIGVVVAALGLAVYGQVYVTPGYASWQDKTSTLLREVGLGPLLDRWENWRYTRQAPPDLPPDLHALIPAGAVATPLRAYSGLPALARSVDNAGWHSIVRTPGAPPLVYTAFVQPDPLHRSVVVGVGLIRSSAVHAHLMAGTSQPPGFGSPGRIPRFALPDRVAAFNSGFKMSAQPGGFFLDGIALPDLVDGKASAVIDDAGQLTVGQWGRDVRMTPHVVAVRQNLALIVEAGRAVPGLDRNTDRRWGSTRNQLQYTWRSGMGVTSHGDVVYVAGDKLNLVTLASAMAQVGVVTGMELDIHNGMEFFTFWKAAASGTLGPQRLMATMSGPANRYVRPEGRDFFYFTADRSLLRAK